MLQTLMCFRKKIYNNDLATGNQRGDTHAEGQKKPARDLRKSGHRQQRHRRDQRRDDDTLREVAHMMPEYDAEREATGMLKKIEEILKREAELQSEWESRKLDSQASTTQGEAASNK